MTSLELHNMINAIDEVIEKHGISIRFIRGGGDTTSLSYPVPTEVFALFIGDELERNREAQDEMV